MLPAAAAIRKQGANKGATSAFLIATPESGVDSIAVTWALLDPLMTVMRPIAAFMTAMVAGIGENLFFWRKMEKEIVIDNSCPVDRCCDGIDCPEEVHKHHHSTLEKSVAGLRFAFGSVWGDIAGWFFIGVLLAAGITVAVPQQVIVTFLGGGFSSMLLMLVVGVPLYICATASTPVAAALILKGVSPGVVLVFLLVGPATNITSLSVLIGILGKRSTVLYLASISLCSVVFGLLVDFFYNQLGVSAQAVIEGAVDPIPFWIKMFSAVVLCVISVKPLWKSLKARTEKKNSSQQTFMSDFPIIEKKDHSQDCG